MMVRTGLGYLESTPLEPARDLCLSLCSSGPCSHALFPSKRRKCENSDLLEKTP